MSVAAPPRKRHWRLTIMPSFSLAALTVLELAPPALIDVAAACGYQQVGLRLLPAVQGCVAYPLMEDEAGLETPARLDATGITVADLGGRARPETEIAASLFLETGARLGARHILVAAYDPDLHRFRDRYAAFWSRGPGVVSRSQIAPWTYALIFRLRAALSASGSQMPGCWWMRCISTGRGVQSTNSRASRRTGCIIGKYATARPSGPPRRKP
jgi:hypothetical protein